MVAGGAVAALILVVDAHGLIGSSLAIALQQAGFPEVVAAAPDVLSRDVDVISAGVAAGGIALVGLLFGDGRTTLPLVRLLAGRGWRVMVMTSDQGLSLTGECLGSGAEAVLDKSMSFERLVAVLERLSAGGSAMTEQERSALLESVRRYEAAERALHEPFDALTEREAEVLVALADGSTAKQIAHRTGITISTVRGHIRGVLSKLNVNSQREALTMARYAGWPNGKGAPESHRSALAPELHPGE